MKQDVRSVQRDGILKLTTKIIGHDLKQPLTSLQAYGYFLKKKSGEGDQIYEYGSKVEDKVMEMTEMINLAVGALKWVRGDYKLDLEWMNWLEILTELPVAKDRVKVEVDEGWIVQADEARLQEIFRRVFKVGDRLGRMGEVVVDGHLRENVKSVRIKIKYLEGEELLSSQWFNLEGNQQILERDEQLGLIMSRIWLREMGGDLQIEEDGDWIDFLILLKSQ